MKEHKPFTDEELQELAQLNSMALPNWFYEDDEYMWQLFGGNGLMPLQILKAPKKDTPYAEYWPSEPEAKVMVAARNALPRLLAEVGRLQKARVQVRELTVDRDALSVSTQSIQAVLDNEELDAWDKLIEIRAALDGTKEEDET